MTNTRARTLDHFHLPLAQPYTVREDRPLPQHPITLVHLGIGPAVREGTQRFRDFRAVFREVCLDVHVWVGGDERAEGVHEFGSAREGEARGDDWLDEGTEGSFLWTGGEASNVGDQVLRVGDGGIHGGFAVVVWAVSVHVAFPNEGPLT